MNGDVNLIIRLLNYAAEQEMETDKAKRRAKESRKELERFVWSKQKENPNFGVPLNSLGMGELAAESVAKKKEVKTIGQLCQYTLAEICPPGSDKRPAQELRDLLRQRGLVFKPQD